MKKEFRDRCWSCEDAPIVTGEKKKHCRELGHEILSEPSPTNESSIDKTEEEDKRLVLKLYEFAESQIRKKAVSNYDSSKVYALLSMHSHKETIELSSKRAISWLKIAYFKKTNEIISDQLCQDAMHLIKEKTLFEEIIPRETVHKRTSFANSEIYYDLCSQDWKLVKITLDSISIVSHDENTPLFERSKNQAEQTKPSFEFQDDPLESFCRLLRISNDLFKIHLISLFIEDVPIPVMAFVGLQGSVKSTTCALIKRIVDPSGEMIEDNLSHFPSKIDDLNIHFANNYLSSFDNISYISDDMSDNLCKAITGASYTKRMLYTDQEEVLLKFKRKIVANGISFNIDRGDLAERTIQYFTHDVPKSERKSMRQIETEFSTLLPNLLGHIFTTLKNALAVYNKAKDEMQNLPRMADFVIWGEAISLALGFPKGTFLKLYEEEMQKGNEILSEGNPLVSFLDEFLMEKDQQRIPASYFFAELLRFAEENHFDVKGGHFPKGSNKLRGYIERNKPLLKEHGIVIEIFKNTEKNGFTKNSTLIEIKKISSPQSPSSQLEFFSVTQSEHGEDSEYPVVENYKKEESDEL